LKRVLENPDEARDHVSKLRNYITENLTWRETTNKMITIYEEILSNGGDS
jgi:glycosyltransferase involved in cell wall biosynthesis